jgi:hypothetical protein
VHVCFVRVFFYSRGGGFLPVCCFLGGDWFAHLTDGQTNAYPSSDGCLNKNVGVQA